MIHIDARDGGGQMLRTALALSVFTGRPFAMEGIRACRPKPGLKSQHLTLVQAMAQASDAGLKCDGVGADSLTFTPGELNPRPLPLDIGTAGSITLLLQGLMVPLLPSAHTHRITIKGGTDVRWSPPIDFLRNIIIPGLSTFADMTLFVGRRGYYPKGGGEVDITIHPDRGIGMPIQRENRGELVAIRGIAHASKSLIDASVAERMGRRAEMSLSSMGVPVSITTEYADTASPGAGLVLWGVSLPEKEADPIYIGADALGEKGTKAEDVAQEACDLLKNRLDSGAACDTHLADHLIPYLAMRGGSITADRISNHIRTNISVCKAFLDTEFSIEGNTITASKA